MSFSRVYAVIRASSKSIHSWILCSGIIFGLGVYLPTCVFLSAKVLVSGMPHLVLNLVFVFLAVQRLRRDRQSELRTIEDQWLGSAFILGGLVLFYLYYPAIAPQAFSCMIILIGAVLSCRGLAFLKRQWIAIVLLVLSLHPNLQRVARHFWQLVAEPDQPAKFMAWGGGELLRVIGQPVSVRDQFVVLPAGVVKVAPGCDGFEMAFVMLITAVILGLAYHLRPRRLIELIAIGVTLALVLNVFRIAVMVLAAVYWGEASFEFWHGTIGGQIFSGILFTIYHYATQPTLNGETAK